MLYKEFNKWCHKLYIYIPILKKNFLRYLMSQSIHALFSDSLVLFESCRTCLYSLCILFVSCWLLRVLSCHLVNVIPKEVCMVHVFSIIMQWISQMNFAVWIMEEAGSLHLQMYELTCFQSTKWIVFIYTLYNAGNLLFPALYSVKYSVICRLETSVLLDWNCNRVYWYMWKRNYHVATCSCILGLWCEIITACYKYKFWVIHWITPPGAICYIYCIISM